MKDTTFIIRISSKDLETIQKKVKQAHLSQSDYVTRCCLGRQVVIIEGLKDVLKALRSIGNNLNQLVTLAHMGRVTVLNLESTAQALVEIRNAVRGIAEKKHW